MKDFDRWFKEEITKDKACLEQPKDIIVNGLTFQQVAPGIYSEEGSSNEDKVTFGGDLTIKYQAPVHYVDVPSSGGGGGSGSSSVKSQLQEFEKLKRTVTYFKQNFNKHKSPILRSAFIEAFFKVYKKYED